MCHTKIICSISSKHKTNWVTYNNDAYSSNDYYIYSLAVWCKIKSTKTLARELLKSSCGTLALFAFAPVFTPPLCTQTAAENSTTNAIAMSLVHEPGANFSNQIYEC